MTSYRYVREQRRYTVSELMEILRLPENKAVKIIKALKEYGVLKIVKLTDAQKDLSDLLEYDIEIADAETYENEYFYVFTFVGVIAVFGCIIKCYPKYLTNATEPKEEMKQILNVIDRYNHKNQRIRMFNESVDNGSFNLLSIMIFLLQDYYDNGLYSNTKDIFEINGTGEIMWDKTINDTFTILSNNKPYYPELISKKRVGNEYDYFTRLHKCILTMCSKELDENELIYLFDLRDVYLSDEMPSDFGDKEYVLYRIHNELNVQFNTHKQLVLKALYAYISHNSRLSNNDCFTIYGTNSFNLVWESVCSEIMNNQLKISLGELNLPNKLNAEYNKNSTLESIISKPKWADNDIWGKRFEKEADTLIPDLISIGKEDGRSYFIIFDAKYYKMQLERDKPLRGQPGLESIIKQYLYQLAFQAFINKHGFDIVRNCFLMPTQKNVITNKGEVSMAMFHINGVDLQPIQNILIPAREAYDLYLQGKKLDIRWLQL